MNPFNPSNYNGPIFLNYKECQRVHCGLRWDPASSDAIQAVDLDLSYIAYDEYGRLIAAVSGKDGIKISEGGSFYHSGDDDDGSDDADDERVTLNLFDMPRHISHIFLVAEVSSKHKFGSVKKPFMRISQDASREDLVAVELGGRLGEDEKAFAFIRLERKTGGWELNYLGKYPGSGEVPEWPAYLKNYLPETLDPRDAGVDLPEIPKKGEKAPLFYKKEARHRVVCGLSWDAATVAGSAAFDLDLTCLLFDAQGAYHDYVSTDRAIDASGAVYHSGDDDTGAGEGDDEQISVELIRLPEQVHHIIFVAEAKSNHALGEVLRPQVRIADGMTNRSQLTVDLSEGDDKNACIFIRLVREGESWALHYIGDFIDSRNINNWAEPLVAYTQ